MSKSLKSIVKQQYATDDGDSRLRVVFERLEQIEKNAADFAERLIDAIFFVQSEPEKNRRFRTGKDRIDEVLPQFKQLTDVQRDTVLECLGGELGQDIVDAWYHLDDFPYTETSQGRPLRCRLAGANFDRRLQWLKQILLVLYQFPYGIVTPQWLAVHAGGIDLPDFPPAAKVLGPFGDGALLEDSIGTLLGSVIAHDGPSSKNVFDTLTQVFDGAHPVAEYGSYVLRGLWQSRKWQGYEVLLAALHLFCKSHDPGEIELMAYIVNSSREAGSESLIVALDAVVSDELFRYQPIAMIIGAWIDMPLHQWDVSRRKKVVECLLDGLRDADDLDFRSLQQNSIDCTDAICLLWSVAMTDAAKLPEFITRVEPLILPTSQAEFATACISIPLPAGILAVDDRRWLELLRSSDFKIAAVALFKWNRNVPIYDELIPALERFEARLPEQYQEQLVPDMRDSSTSDAYRQIVDMAACYIEQMPMETFLKFYQWSCEATAGNGHYKNYIRTIESVTAVERQHIVRLVETGIDEDLLPLLMRLGLGESDFDWLFKHLVGNGYDEFRFKKLLMLPDSQLQSFLEKFSTSQNANHHEMVCKFAVVLLNRKRLIDWVVAKLANWLSMALPKGQEAVFQLLEKLPSQPLAELQQKVCAGEIDASLEITSKFVIASLDKRQPVDLPPAKFEAWLLGRSNGVRCEALKLLRRLVYAGQLREFAAQSVFSIPQKVKKLNRQTKACLEDLRKAIPAGILAAQTGAVETELDSQRMSTRLKIAVPQKKVRERDEAIFARFVEELFTLTQQHRNRYTAVSTVWKYDNGPLEKTKLRKALTTGFRNTAAVNEKFPHRKIWQTWYQSRPEFFQNGVAPMIFAYLMPRQFGDTPTTGDIWRWGDLAVQQAELPIFNHPNIASHTQLYRNTMCVVQWLAYQNPTVEALEFFLDRFESLLADIPVSIWQQQINSLADGKRESTNKVDKLIDLFEEKFQCFASKLDRQDAIAIYQRAMPLLRYADRPLKMVPRRPISNAVLVRAFELGIVGQDDLEDAWDAATHQSGHLDQDTSVNFRFRASEMQETQWLKYQAAIDQYTHQVIENLLAKGSTNRQNDVKIASQLRSVRGIDNLLRLLKRIATKKFKRRTSNVQTNLIGAICQLVFYCIPGPNETLDDFRGKVSVCMDGGWLTHQLLLQLAIYAPQWAGWIGDVVGDDGLKSAVFWLTSHTDRYLENSLAPFCEYNLGIGFDSENAGNAFPERPSTPSSNSNSAILGQFSNSDISPRVSADPLLNIDASWFDHARSQVHDATWKILVDALELVMQPKVYQRLLDVIRAISGELTFEELERRIEEQEAGINDIQLLSLLPLKSNEQRQVDLSVRVKLIQLHRRKASKFKIQKRETALEVNRNAKRLLATRAGIGGDPDRVDWYAMKILEQSIAAVSPACIDQSILSLVIQTNGVPIISIETNGKKRKTIPKAIAKHPQTIQLKELLKQINTESKQAKKSLEKAMIESIPFQAAEICEFISNPLLGRLFRTLVLSDGNAFGLPEMEQNSLLLVDCDSTKYPIDRDVLLYVSHPAELYSTDQLARWRADFNDRVQAIEQLHRKLFRPTALEVQANKVLRFADYAIRPDQARAIFQKLGWSTDQYFGPCWYTKYGPGKMVARASMDWVDSSVSRDCMEIVEVEFAGQSDLALDRVDPKFFSETILEVNQIVSAAELK